MKHNYLTLTLITFIIYFSGSVFACSTFLLDTDSTLIVGHNLDENHEVPGFLVVNKGGITKTSISWNELLKGTNPDNKHTQWISKYGSVTFNAGGAKEFPDSGMNEKGLVVCEMSLGETKFPYDTSHANMFMMQWVQYLLDNCENVQEVLNKVNDFNLDGWGWHFFVADQSGNKAIIEFIDHKVLIHQNEKLPYPVLCNTKYSNELAYIGNFKNYGGEQVIDFNDKEDKNRFVHANEMLRTYASSSSLLANDFGFQILNQLNNTGITKWSIIYDINNQCVKFKTANTSEIKELQFSDIDFSCQTPSMVYNMDTHQQGNIINSLIPYSKNEIKKPLKNMWKCALEKESFLARVLVKKWATKGMIVYNENIICKN